MKLPPLSTYAPSFTSHPADARTQVAVAQALAPARSDAADRVEQFIQAGFAKATALLDQITNSDKPPTLEQLTRYINALTRLVTAKNAAIVAPPSAPKPTPIQNPSASIPRSAPTSQPVPPANHTPAPPAAPNQQPATFTPVLLATASMSQPPEHAANPTPTPLPSVSSGNSVVELPLPSQPNPSLYRPEGPKKRYKMVSNGTPAPSVPHNGL